MAISCVYCGGEHDRADEVRSCWTRSGGVETVAADSEGDDPGFHPGEDDFADDVLPARVPAPPPARIAAGTVAAAAPVAHAVRSASRLAPVADAARWAGPSALGRHLVVLDMALGDQTAPPPWSDAQRVTVDERSLLDPLPVIEQLRSAHHQRQRLVLEVSVGFHRPPAQTDGRELHLVGARGELPLDELHHLVWSNSVVLGPEGARWHWADRAVELGATFDATARASGAAGDVMVNGVGPCFIDGGPVRYSEPIDGAAIIPWVSVEHGSLQPFGPPGCSADLAPDQLQAVTHDGGAARIIAPAGSGKTRVLTERARHLVRAWHIPPSAITLLAYNKRAQNEVQQRLSDVPSLQVRTFNSLALAIINGNAPFAPQSRKWQTLDEIGVRRLLGEFVQSPRKRNVDPLAPWLEALSAVRLGLLTADEVEARYDGDVSGLSDVYPRLEAAMQRSGHVDFDGQIVTAIRLLLTDPAARHTAQRACRLLLVDEFQDLTPAHILLIRLLSAPSYATFGVGDDDQTIYGYNGADPDWLIEYASLFPAAGDHPLEVNYRCPGDVVVAVDRMLRRNHRRVAKTIRSAHPDAVGLRRVSSNDPVAACVEQVDAALAAGTSPADIAVLSRVNTVLVPLQIALGARGVPTSRVAGPEFLTRSSVRSALAWVRLAAGSRDSINSASIGDALQRPSRSLHPRIATWASEQRSIGDLERLAGRMQNDKDARTLLAFVTDIELIQSVAETGTTADVLDLLIDTIGLGGTLASFDINRRGMNAPSQSDDLLTLRHLATLHPNPATFSSWLGTQLDRAPAHSSTGITLSTVHRVKGQEWPFVVVYLADDQQFPHRLADDETEERRLFHVALTRTSREVVVVSTTGQLSPFLGELDRDPSADPVRRVIRSSATPPTAPTGRGSSAKGRAGQTSTDTARDLSASEQELFERLRQFRNDVRAGKPAYTVFDDATLTRLAVAQPATLNDLARIKGVGPMKLEQYGDLVLGVVNTFTDDTA